MKKLLLMALVVMASASLNTATAKDKKEKKQKQTAEAPKPVVITTGNDSLSYAAGMAMTNGLVPYLKQQFGINESQMGDVLRGFNDAAAHRNDSTFSAYVAGMQVATMMKEGMLPGIKNDLGDDYAINEDLVYSGFAASLANDHSLFTDSAAEKTFADHRAAAVEKKNRALRVEGENFLAENKLKPGVVTLPSGLQYKILKQGYGAVPKATDEVEVIYEGRTLDGNVFDSTAKHGTKSDTFNAGRLIKGWTEALTLMPVGSKWELYIPQELAYGERGAGKNIKPYAALIFTLELLNIK